MAYYVTFRYVTYRAIAIGDQPVENKKIATKTVVLSLDHDDIIRMVYKPGAVETVETAREAVKAAVEAFGAKKRPVLIDIREIKSVTREARMFHASEEAGRTGLAVGLVVGSLVTKMIGNFFMNINKPVLPFRMFTSESDAVEWLKHFSEK